MFEAYRSRDEYLPLRERTPPRQPWRHPAPKPFSSAIPSGMTGGNGSPPRPGWGQLLHALDGYSDWALPGLLFFLYLESGDRDFLILLGAYLYYNGGGKLLGK